MNDAKRVARPLPLPIQSRARTLTPPAQLPPVPETPKRSLTPAAREALASGIDEPDAATPRRTTDIAEYQALLSLFDPMSHEERFEFIELGRLFVELGPEGREAATWVIRQLYEKNGKR